MSEEEYLVIPDREVNPYDVSNSKNRIIKKVYSIDFKESRDSFNRLTQSDWAPDASGSNLNKL